MAAVKCVADVPWLGGFKCVPGLTGKLEASWAVHGVVHVWCMGDDQRKALLSNDP